MPMTDEEFDAFVAESVEQLEKKQDKLQREFGLGGHAAFLFDQATGTLEFKHGSGAVQVTAQVVPIGSFSERSETWQWAWANDSFPPALRDKAQDCRRLESTTGFGVFAKELLFLPRSVAETHTDLRRWTVFDRGGHFAPAERPDAVVAELRAFFAGLA